MAIAKRIIPKTFLRIAIPVAPMIRSKVEVNFSTIHTTKIFKKIAIKIFTRAYSARKEINEVMVPAPAIIGNASGTIEATLVDSSP